MLFIIKPFQNANLDIVLGSLSSAFLAVSAMQSHLPTLWWLAVPISCWTAYSLDRIKDACHILSLSQTQSATLSERHAFHAKHRNCILTLILFFSLTVPILVYLKLPRLYLYFGLVMGFYAGLHIMLSTTHRYKVLKEWHIATIYTLSVWGLPIILSPQAIWPTSIYPLFFFLIALLNLTVYSIHDVVYDTHFHLSGLHTIIGQSGLIKLALLIPLVCITLFILGLSQGLRPDILTILLLMTFLNGLMLRAKSYYRYIGEGSFLLPTLLVFL